MEKEPQYYKIGPFIVKAGPGKVSDNWGTRGWLIWGIVLLFVITWGITSWR